MQPRERAAASYGCLVISQINKRLPSYREKVYGTLLVNLKFGTPQTSRLDRQCFQVC